MNKLKRSFKNYGMLASGLAYFALVFSIIAANSRCMGIYHELEKPDDLKKLKKY